MAYMRISDGKILSVKDGSMPQLYVGTDAGKPSPGIGDIAICSDTGKVYSCNVADVWSIVSSPSYEFYSNHTGAVDNFTTTSATGNATASTDAANHRMDLSSGITVVGEAHFRMLTNTNIATTFFEYNCKIQALANGATGVGFARLTRIGMMVYPFSMAGYGGAMVAFSCEADNIWRCESFDGNVTRETTVITALADGDLVSIIAKKQNIVYLVNGVIVATHNLVDMSGFNLTPAIFAMTDGSATVARTISCDFMSYKKYL